MSRNSTKVNIALIVIGVVVFIAGLVIQMANKAFIESAESTSAYVTDVTKSRNTLKNRSSYSYTAYITYTVDGVERNTAITSGASSLREGSTITVYYDPLNPTDVRTASSAKINKGMVPGIMLAVLGVLGIFKAKKEE